MFISNSISILGKYVSAYSPKEPPFYKTAVGIILISLVLGFIVYTVPVLIYRFGVLCGAPVQNTKKAVLINFVFFAFGVVAFVIINALAGSFEDPDYRFGLGLIDVLFWGIDLCILVADGKRSGIDQTTNRSAKPVDYLSKYSKSDNVGKAKCSKCGFSLPSGAKFCTECGEKYVPKAVEKTVICTRCGKTIKLTNFCPECGTKTAQKKEEDEKPPRDPTFEEMFENDSSKRK